MLGAKLAYFFMLTIAVTALVAPLIVWRYAAAVLAGMRVAAGTELGLPAPRSAGAETTSVQPPGTGASGGSSRLAWERGLRRRVVAAWLLCTAGAGLPLVFAYLHGSGLPPTPLNVVLVLAVIVLVAIPPLVVSLGWTWLQGLWRTLWLSAAASMIVFIVSVLQRVFSGRAPTVDQALNLLIYYQVAAAMLWPALLMLMASGAPRVRAVVPAAFGALIVFGAAPFLAGDLWMAIAATEAGTQAMLQSDWLKSRHLLFAALALPFAALMAWRLRALSQAYGGKRFSDVQLLARAWWLMFAALMAIELVAVRDQPLLGVAACLASIALFGPLQALVFAQLQVARDAPPPRTLLLLRVFGFRSRTERLFDRIGARWRYHGPVTMIAAPDVAARTIDAVDFLDWLLGRTGDSFVRNADELRLRLAALDNARDPDGRFRINELCCADNTWRASVVELMQRADVVLMDLRGITVERKGCEFELQQLGARVDPRRIVLVVEPGADRAPLHAAMGPAAAHTHWHELPDRRLAPTARLFEALCTRADGSSCCSR